MGRNGTGSKGKVVSGMCRDVKVFSGMCRDVKGVSGIGRNGTGSNDNGLFRATPFIFV